MGFRRVVGLKEAAALAERPVGIPVGRARGRKAYGVRYENGLAKALAPWAVQGQWWRYVDVAGQGCCQTDLVLLDRSGRLVVLESKYTWVEQGHGQLEQLYRPVLETATGLQIFGVVVCKNLRPDMADFGVSICPDLGQALAARGHVAWQWLGGRPQGLGDLFAPVKELRTVLSRSLGGHWPVAAE